MVFVKIKRDSIRKNPNAGITETFVTEGAETKFRIEGSFTLPTSLRDGVDAVITSWLIDEFGGHCEGVLLNIKAFEKLNSLGAQITTTSQVRTVRHAAEPDYLYTYEDPVAICSNCLKHIPVSAIVTDMTTRGDGDEYYYEECPECHSQNSFPEIVYETIEQALK